MLKEEEVKEVPMVKLLKRRINDYSLNKSIHFHAVNTCLINAMIYNHPCNKDSKCVYRNEQCMLYSVLNVLK